MEFRSDIADLFCWVTGDDAGDDFFRVPRTRLVFIVCGLIISRGPNDMRRRDNRSDAAFLSPVTLAEDPCSCTITSTTLLRD